MVIDLVEVTQLLSIKAGIQAQACLTSNPELFPLYFAASWEKKVLRRNGNLAHKNTQKEKNLKSSLISPYRDILANILDYSFSISFEIQICVYLYV